LKNETSVVIATVGLEIPGTMAFSHEMAARSRSPAGVFVDCVRQKPIVAAEGDRATAVQLRRQHWELGEAEAVGVAGESGAPAVRFDALRSAEVEVGGP
jgi:hypothetical protein